MKLDPFRLRVSILQMKTQYGSMTSLDFCGISHKVQQFLTQLLLQFLSFYKVLIEEVIILSSTFSHFN